MKSKASVHGFLGEAKTRSEDHRFIRDGHEDRQGHFPISDSFLLAKKLDEKVGSSVGAATPAGIEHFFKTKSYVTGILEEYGSAVQIPPMETTIEDIKRRSIRR
ncbi:hypothetical protein E2C01_008912 [Portunus trituberculatus]|uniref:Uncharacterized protein n=1 Tax=Portunus trituberculatus TaxID=210409 RepID=A0A5B7D224_PORTR|nr:hypothetical protein [Portunus trituberculatus]